MNCQTHKEQLSLLTDGALSAEHLPALFRHLSECADCRNFFLHVKVIHETALRMPPAAAPDAADRIIRTLTLGAETPPMVNTTFTVKASSALFSLGLVILMTVFIYGMGKVQEQEMSRQYVRTVYERGLSGDAHTNIR